MNIYLNTYVKTTLLAAALACSVPAALYAQSNAFWAGQESARSLLQDFIRCYVKKKLTYQNEAIWLELMGRDADMDSFGNLRNQDFLNGMLQELLQTDIRELLRDATDFDRAQLLAIYYYSIDYVRAQAAGECVAGTWDVWHNIVRKSIEKAVIEVYGNANLLICDIIKKQISHVKHPIYISYLFGR